MSIFNCLFQRPVISSERVCRKAGRAVQVARGERAVAIPYGNRNLNLRASQFDAQPRHSPYRTLTPDKCQFSLGRMEYPVFPCNLEAFERTVIQESVRSIVKQDEGGIAVDSHLGEKRSLARISKTVGLAESKHREPLANGLLLSRVYIVELIFVHEIIGACKSGLGKKARCTQLLSTKVC